ncbi:MAG: hypothetical protein LAN18_03680 [Acidobacteriia bacterium]|nr:hypothetical protein [Terriglobia bacterium]
MAELGAWASIHRHGLLSTTALLDLFSIDGDARYQLESRHRPRSEQINNSQLGTATIRDQGPMSDSALVKCLRGMTPREWYELLNRMVFFWVTEERVNNLLEARRYRDGEHTVITVDTASLLEHHNGRIKLSPINSGSTLYKPQPRGRNTFLPLTDYPYADRRKKRGIANAVAELAVDYSVPDLLEHAVRVERRHRSLVVEVIYEKHGA